jgi:filamentous hemagglutinin family protein
MQDVRNNTMAKWLLFATVVALSVVVLPYSASAGEIAPQEVVAGSAEFSQVGNNTIIEAADRTIINYTTFNVDPNEMVTFVQPGAQASVLNRVLSADPSYLLGTIQANGCVYFVNPAGVVIGADAVINAAQFHAAAGAMANSDFLSGVNRFGGLSGSVTNLGMINAPEGVSLLGQEVLNSGSILADRGLVTLCAGEEVYVAEENSGLVVRVDNLDAVTGQAALATPVDAEGAGVVNEGAVTAADAVFSCGDVYSLAVVNAGTVTANGGQVVLSGNGDVRNEGTIDVSSSAGVGGTAKLLGNRVVMQGGVIDASGAAGGGTVLLGGNYQGTGDERQASVAFVDGASSIVADATSAGDGGTVVVWADGKTGFYGSLSSRGGADGGEGGLAEVSGTDVLDFVGIVDLFGVDGVGTLLLDPTNIIVATGGGAAYTDVNAFDAGAGDETIAPATLDAVQGNIVLQAKNDITVTNALTLNFAGDTDGNPAAKLTMRAGNDITVNAGVTTSGGAISLVSNDALSGNQSGSGSIVLNSSLSTTGNAESGANIALTVDGGTGSVTLAAAIDAGTGNLSGSASTVEVSSNVASIQDAIDIVDGGGVINVTGANTYDEALVVNKAVSIKGKLADGVTNAWAGATAGADATAPVITGTSDAVITVTSDDVTLQGLAIDSTGQAKYGVSVNANGSDLTVDHCTLVHDNTQIGDTNGDHALTLRPDLNNTVIDDVTVSWNVFDTTAGTDGWGLVLGNVTDLIVQQNVFDQGILFAIGGGSATSEDVNITSNTFNDFAGAGIQFVRDGAGALGSSDDDNDLVQITQNVFNSRSVGIYFFATSDALADADELADSLQASNFGEEILLSENAFTNVAVSEVGLQVCEDDTSLNITIDARNNFWDSANGPTADDNLYNVGSQGASIVNGGEADIYYQPWWSALTVAVPGTLAGTPLNLIRNATTGSFYTDFATAIAAATNGDVLEASPATYAEAVLINKDVTIEVEAKIATATSWTSTVASSIGLDGEFATGGGNFAFAGGVTLAGDTVLNSAGGSVVMGSLDGSVYDLILAAGIGAGTTTFLGEVSDLGSGAGAALLIEEGVTGLVTFGGDFSANSGIVAEKNTSKVLFDGAVALSDGDTGTSLPGTVTFGPNSGEFGCFDGLTLNTVVLQAGAAAVRFGSNGSDIQIDTLTGGGRDLAFASGTDSVTIEENVANLGDGVGPALQIEGGVGLVRFMGTLGANSGLTASDGTSLRFDGDVTISGGDTSTALLGNVQLDGLTLSSQGAVLLGNDATDQVTLSSSPVTITAANADVTIKARVDGNRSLILGAGTGDVTLEGALGSLTSLSSLSATGGSVEVASTVRTDGQVTLAATNGDLLLKGNIDAGGQASLTSTGYIAQTSGVLTAPTVSLTAADGIYGLLDLEALGLNPSNPPLGYDNQAFSVSTLQLAANNSGSSNVNIENVSTNGITITALTTAGGDINFKNSNDQSVSITGGVSSGSGGVDGGDVSIVGEGTILLNAVVDTGTGTGGAITIRSGVTQNSAPVAGAGDILVAGGDDDVYINTAMVSETTISISAQRDIYLLNSLATINPTANIVLAADSNANGQGGISIDGDGRIDSAGSVSLTGSDLTSTAGVDSISVAADQGGTRILAEGTVNLTSATHSHAADDASISVMGTIESTEDAVQISATGDLTVGGALKTNAEGSGITLTADLGDSGLGGVTLETAGSIESAGGVTVTGADLASTGGTDIDSIVIEVAPGGTDLQISAQGNIALNSSTASEAPDDGSIQISGKIESAEGEVDVAATGDIIIEDQISTLLPGRDIRLRADQGDSGLGGVHVTLAGAVASAGGVTVTGSDLTTTGGVVDSIVIDDDGTNDQIVAEDAISLISLVADRAPDDAAIQILGDIESTEGTITVRATGDVQIDGELLTELTGSGVTIVADEGDSGSGGVDLQAGGAILSAGGVTLTGAELTANAGTSVLIAADAGGAEQIVAEGAIALNSSSAAQAPDDTNIQVLGDITSTKGTITIDATGDVVLGAVVKTDLTGNGVTVTADRSDTGVGGVSMQAAGAIRSAGAVTIVGSDLSTTASPIIDSIVVAAGGIAAEGDISLTSSTAAQAPDDGDIQIGADVTSSEGTIVVSASGDVSVDAIVTTTLTGKNITLTGDLGDSGDGGVSVSAAGGIVSGGQANLTGADVIATAGVVDSVTVAAGAAQIVAEGAIRLSSSTAAQAPDDAGIEVLGDLQSTEGTIDVLATGDVVVDGGVKTDLAGRDVTLRADVDDNGVGGVHIQDDAAIDSAGGVTVQGSDLASTGGVIDSVVIDADGANLQISAVDEISLVSSTVDQAPDDAEIQILGHVETTDGTIDVQASGDLTVGARLKTSLDGAGITLVADAGDSGVGGVNVQLAGRIESAGDVSMTGADLASTAGVTDSIVIAAEAASMQVEADGSITLTSSTADRAPDDADILILGRLVCTEDGSITVTPTDEIRIDGSLTGVTELLTAPGGISLNGPVVLTGATRMGTVYAGVNDVDDGDINFLDTIDGGFGLILSAGQGSISFANDVGGTTAVGNIVIASADDVTAARRELKAGEDAGAFGDDYDEETNTVPVNITASRFNHANGGGEFVLSGDLTTTGLAGVAGGDVNIQTDEAITIEGGINTSGGAAVAVGQDGGDVILISADAGVQVAGITTSGSDAVNGAGGDAGDVTMQVTPDLTSRVDVWVPEEMLVLNGDITAAGGAGAGGGADGVGGTVQLNGLGRTEIPAVATISGNPEGGDVTITALNFIMGQNEKFTVLASTDEASTADFAEGDLSIVCVGGNITVGDLTAQDDLVINAGAAGNVTLRRRGSGDVALVTGQLFTDAGLDLVAGDLLNLIGNVILGGATTDSPTLAAHRYVANYFGPDVSVLQYEAEMTRPLLDTMILDGAASGDSVRPPVRSNDIAELEPRLYFEPVAVLSVDPFGNADANSDGRLSLQEFRRYADEEEVDLRSLFERIDIDSDGYVSRSELDFYLRRYKRLYGWGAPTKAEKAS